MCTIIDCETILSVNEHWSKLDEAWGTPIDLDTEEEYQFVPPRTSFFSTMDLRKPKPTFDSALVIKKQLQTKQAEILQKSLNYNDFIQALDQEEPMKKLPEKQFYFVGGQLISAESVDEICGNIDDVFKSIEKLCATTSTVRRPSKTKRIPDLIECSFSLSDLSFDDTDKDRPADLKAEVCVHVENPQKKQKVETKFGNKGTVTSLVKKFTYILESPSVQCKPRRHRECSKKFRDLTMFWKNRTLEL